VLYLASTTDLRACGVRYACKSLASSVQSGACLIDVKHPFFLIRCSSSWNELVLSKYEVFIIESCSVKRCPSREDRHNVKTIRIPKQSQHMFLDCDRPARKVRGIFSRENPRAIPNIFEIKLTLIAGYIVATLVVLLNVEDCEHREIHIDSNPFRVICQTVGNPM
jgi:hypothetical protein